MVLEQKLTLKMSQKLIMTPSLQQAIKLLQMSKLELQEEISQELVENPVLEETIDEGVSLETAKKYEVDGAAPPKERESDETDYEAFFRNLEDSWVPEYQREEKEDTPTFENVLTKPSTLADHLLWQLHMTSLSQEQKEIGEVIIGNLDEDGYLKATREEIRDSGNFQMEDIEKTLMLIQEFDPVGVAARDLTECLKIQLRIFGIEDRAVYEIVERHLDKLQKKHYRELASILGCTMKKLESYIEIIKGLEPKPGRKYSTEKSHYVIPDVYVFKVEDEWVIQLNDEGLPKLRISPMYRRMAERGSYEDQNEAKEFVRNKLRSAFRLIKSLEERQRTIYKVARSIVNFQRNFLDHGIERLKPMVLRDVAEDIGVHESTVCRVVNNKYMHTPRGLFEMKFFFHSGLASSEGEDVSSLAVKNSIKQLIDQEDPKKPLSDSNIAKILSTRGLKIARRTVAKYRENLRIPSSNIRRQVFPN
ncbi:MAG: RNA polymerase factor sigma-54 [Acidobacteriota bacterium]